jgi:hypothetical protein
MGKKVLEHLAKTHLWSNGHAIPIGCAVKESPDIVPDEEFIAGGGNPVVDLSEQQFDSVAVLSPTNVKDDFLVILVGSGRMIRVYVRWAAAAAIAMRRTTIVCGTRRRDSTSRDRREVLVDVERGGYGSGSRG